jgi:hypothetical protein
MVDGADADDLLIEVGLRFALPKQWGVINA